MFFYQILQRKRNGEMLLDRFYPSSFLIDLEKEEIEYHYRELLFVKDQR